MATELRGESLLRLSLTIDPAEIGEFYPFLMKGFQVIVGVGCSVRELLRDQFGIDDEYVVGRITTVFQNGRAVDDLDGALDRLRANGIPMPWGVEADARARWVMFQDPAGNLIELVQAMRGVI